MKKLLFIYIGIFSFAFMGLGYVIHKSPNPEEAILGQWQESDWTYERVYKKHMKDHRSDDREGFREQTGLVPALHKTETWTFLPQGKLVLNSEDNGEKTAKWSIKGRGSDLEIKYEDGATEHYNINHLMNGLMTLNFDLDTQVIKGIAKLTFEKI